MRLMGKEWYYIVVFAVIILLLMVFFKEDINFGPGKDSKESRIYPSNNLKNYLGGLGGSDGSMEETFSLMRQSGVDKGSMEFSATYCYTTENSVVCENSLDSDTIIQYTYTQGIGLTQRTIEKGDS